MKRLIFIAVLLFFAAGFVFSADFGLLIDQKIEAEKDLFTYTPGFTPWFSWNNGSGVSVYLSGIFSFKYANYGDDFSGWAEPALTPEISRFALHYRVNQGMSLEAGRIMYTDVLGFTANGLFDGVRFEYDIPAGSVNAALLYSGLLYKETANIIMTAEDAADFASPWDWDNFGYYFASKRFLASVRWDMPIGEVNNLCAELLAQFDLNDSEQTLNSQYGAVKMDFFPASTIWITAGALFEAMQNNDGDFGMAFGLLAQLKTELPTPLNDSLTISAKFTSASSDDAFACFTPVSSVSQGMVFSGPLAGLAVVGAEYNARVIDTVFAEAAFRYFIKTYEEPGATDDGNLYGGELSASFIFQPFDDLRAAFGAGIFIPGMGNVYPSGTDAMWKISAGLIFSL